jgi:hypothetical protein
VARLDGLFDHCGPLREGALAREFSSALISPVALRAPLAGSSQVCVEQCSFALVWPDVAVDGQSG